MEPESDPVTEEDEDHQIVVGESRPSLAVLSKKLVWLY